MKHFAKLIALVLALVFVLSLAACKKAEEVKAPAAVPATAAPEAETPETQAPETEALTEPPVTEAPAPEVPPAEAEAQPPAEEYTLERPEGYRQLTLYWTGPWCPTRT